MLTLSLLDRSGLGDFRGRLRSGAGNLRLITDPSFGMKAITEEDLRWYLEDYAPKYPYDITRASQVEVDLMTYGQTLVDSFQVLSIEMVRLVLSSYKNEDEPIVIDVLDNECPSLLQAIHWEVLESAASWNPEASGHANVLVRRKIVSSFPRLVPTDLSSRKKPTFNILLVNSRPNKVKDINPLLGIRGIIETLSKLEPRLRDTINFEIVRPGTWSAFEDHLIFRTNQWHQSGGTGPWFDIVHFDVHGEIVEGNSHLIFLSKGGKSALAVSASTMAQLLRHCKIESVFINSCLSAKALGFDTSNLAEFLIRNGIRSAIAMSFAFTSSAAKRLITNFYSIYLLDPLKNMDKALKYSRDALQTNMEREATFGLKVHVKDFIIPVLYIDHHWKNEYIVPEVSLEPPDPDSYTMNAAPQPSIVRVLAQNDLETQLQSNHANFGGREQDIMEIEALLLRNAKSNILVLHGMAGAGKSALIQFLGWWWGITELVQNTIYYSLAPDLITQEHEIPKELVSVDGLYFQNELYRYLQQQRRLFIIDDFDAMLHPRFTKDREVSYTDIQKEQLRNFISRLRGGRSLVILVSRCKHDWLNLGIRAQYCLRELAHYDSTLLASSCLRDLNLSHMLENRENTVYLGHFVAYVDHNPQAILTFLRVLKEDQQISNPRKLLETLQTGFVTLSPSYERQMCMLFIRRLKLTPGLNGMLLHGLAPLWSTFTEDWFESLSESLKQEKPTVAPSKNEVLEFFVSNAVDTGWLEIEGESAARKTVFRIDPILSNLLRETISWGEDHNPVKKWEAVCTSTTAIYHWFQLQNMTTQDIATPTLEPVIQHEISNYLYALGVCLYLMPYQPTFTDAGYQIFFELWSIATTGNNLLLPVPSMLTYGDQFMNNLLESHGDLNNMNEHEMAYFFQLSTMICRYLVRRQPTRAASYLEPIVKTFPKLEAIIVEKVPQTEILYSFTLLSLGAVAMYKDRDVEKAEEYFLKVASQATLADNDSNPELAIKRRWLEMNAYLSLQELYMNNEKQLDRRGKIREAAKDAFKKYKKLVSTSSSDRTKTLALGYVPAALVEWAMTSPQDPQISSLLSLSEQGAETAGLLKVAPMLGEASRLLKNGKTAEARQVLLEAVSQAMSAEDKEAEYPCQLNLAIIASQEGNIAAADLHLRRLKILEEELHGGAYVPLSSLKVVSAAKASVLEVNI
ncbi:hypothetical protein B7463_g5906, partial [Scytalidium lignicola]